MTILELKNINKKYNDRSIFHNYNLKIEQGDFAMIVGKSGKGKTTLLNIIALLEDFEGDVLFKNKKVKNKTLYYRNNISYVFQHYLLNLDQTVNENLCIVQKYNKKVKQEKIKNIDDILKKLNIFNLKDKLTSTLSGGEQQRVALAKIYLKDSDIILCDEPTGSLDDENTKIVMNFLKELNQSNKTIIMVTHDMNLLKYSSKIIELE